MTDESPYWKSTVNPAPAQITREALERAFQKMSEGGMRVCGVTDPHILSPRSLEEDGWYGCGNCFQPVPIHDGKVDYVWGADQLGR